MKLGLVGVNPITQLAVEIDKLNTANNSLFIFDDNPSKQGKVFYGQKVIGCLSEIEGLFKNNELDGLHICLGEKHLALKKNIFNKFSSLGLAFPNLIDPSCIISPACRIGLGNLFNSGSIVGHNAIIGDNTTIWSGVVVEHDSNIHSHAYIGPNVTISGFVEIGECTLIGSGAVILPEVKIGKNCLIGAGSVVTKNIDDNQIIKGNPAR
tara:strand:- start:4086 stop:4712 length:627 start_codon:yes stop_codon:yes gene_type:complete